MAGADLCRPINAVSATIRRSHTGLTAKDSRSRSKSSERQKLAGILNASTRKDWANPPADSNRWPARFSAVTLRRPGRHKAILCRSGCALSAIRQAS